MKGGSGTTVTAALTALRMPGDSLIVDLGGDMTDVLGTRPPAWTLDDFLLDPSVGELDDIVIEVAPNTRLLPSARRVWPDTGSEKQRQALHDWLDRQRGTIVVDAGTGVPGADLVARADRTLVVTRSCYLSLIRGARSGFVPDECQSSSRTSASTISCLGPVDANTRFLGAPNLEWGPSARQRIDDETSGQGLRCVSARCRRCRDQLPLVPVLDSTSVRLRAFSSEDRRGRPRRGQTATSCRPLLPRPT